MTVNTPSRMPAVARLRRTLEVDLRWNVLTAGTILLFSAALYYTYKLKVVPLYAYSGLTYRQPDRLWYPVVLGMVILVALTMPHRINRVSDFILWVLFVFCVAPSMLLAQYSRTLPRTEAVKMGAAIAGAMVMIIILTNASPRFKIPVKRLSQGVDFWLVVLLTSGFMYVYLIFAVGIKVELLALSEVYSTRADFASRSSGNLIIGYLLPIQTNVINPMLFARGIYSRRRLMVLMACLGQALIYSTTGQKSTLFSILAMVGIAILFRFFRRPPGLAVAFAMTAASTGALFVDRIAGSIVWTSLISRRVMIVPGALTAAYVSVFHDRPRMNFADALPFVTDPYYGMSTAKIVGAEFVGNAGTAANVNLFGHGYLNAGYLGMFIEGLVLVVLLALANAATRGLPTAVSSIAFLAPAFALGSASVFTTAGTHGFLAAVFLCAIAPSRGWGKKHSKKVDRRLKSARVSLPPPRR